MKKFGYHRLVLPSGQIIEGPLVIILNHESILTDWYLLKNEEPMVEWIGGTYIL